MSSRVATNDRSTRTVSGPVLRRQYPLRLGGHTIHLDVFAENGRTNFELDGTAWHGGVEQRERELRRDARHAAMGILGCSME
ncbi:MAG TPA: hypothetical protein VKG85_04330 [Actinomycetes bacterium]|nr:hypothetical protein [Actinomycetes bacterium]